MAKANPKEKIQRLANKYCRLRDTQGIGANCISCGSWKEHDQMDGGHFIPTTSGALRFDERNINAQCTKCNRFLHGNARGYYKGMIVKYGLDVVEELESREGGTYKWTIAELEEREAYYKAKLKELEASI